MDIYIVTADYPNFFKKDDVIYVQSFVTYNNIQYAWAIQYCQYTKAGPNPYRRIPISNIKFIVKKSNYTGGSSESGDNTDYSFGLQGI